MPATTAAASSTGLKSKQAPNFSPEEDEQLAKSWVVILEDAIQSNNQKVDNFWARILAEFNKFTPGPHRDAAGLCAR